MLKVRNLCVYYIESIGISACATTLHLQTHFINTFNNHDKPIK